MEDLGASASPLPAVVEPLLGATLWIDRQEEARRVLDFVLSARSRLVILYGKHGIGKTALIERWVIPSVPEGYEVFYGECAPELPQRIGEQDLWAAAARPRTLIFIDSFEALLDLPEVRREELLGDLGTRVSSGQCAATLVLILAEDRLDRAFSLRAQLPELAHAALEIKGISAHESLAALHSVAQQNALDCKPAVLEELAREAGSLESRREGLSPELLKVIGVQLRRVRQTSLLQLDLEEYRGMGGLEGLLRGFLDRQLEDLPARDGMGRELGLAILEEVATARREGRAPELSGLPERLEVTGEDLRRAIAWLQGTGGLLRERKEGGLEVVPQGLVRIVEKEASRRRRETQESQWILREGVRAWDQVGSLLARETFDRVDRQRRRLDVTDDEAELMLRCALRYQPEENLRGARYWVQRIRMEPGQVEILQLSLFDPLPPVRGKAAALLGQFPRPEVRDQLHLLALKDPEERVRATAVESLRQMKSGELREPLMQEAHDESSRYRAEAVDALRIFAEEPTVAVLKEIVDRSSSEGPLRGKAIEVLSSLQIGAAAEALVEIALRDEDADDRAGAAVGLGSLQAEILVRNCLERLRTARSDASGRHGLERLRSWLPSLGRASFAVVVGLGNLFLHGIALIAISRPLLGGLILVAELAGVALFFLWGCLSIPWLLATFCAAQLIPAALLLRERREGRLQPGTFRGALALVLFVTTTLSMIWFFHGLAHAMVGRWRRAAVLLACEVVGITLVIANYAPALRVVHPSVREFYFWVGWILIGGSFVYDVVRVLLDSAMRSEFAQRRWTAYRELLRGRVAPGLLLERLASANRSDVHWARLLLRRCGAEIEPAFLLEHLREKGRARGFVIESLARHKSDESISALCNLWGGADEDLRRAILAVLARQPTEASLAALKRLRPQLSRWQRVRVGFSTWHFRLRVWPRAILVPALLALPLIGSAVYDKIYSYRPHVRLVKEVHEDTRRRVATAEYLATVYPKDTVHDLARVFAETPQEEAVRLGVAHSLGIIANTPEPLDVALRKEALLALVRGLERWPGTQQEKERAAITTELESVEPEILDATGVTHDLDRMLNRSDYLTVRRAALEVLESARAVGGLRDFILAGSSADSGVGARPRLEGLARQRQEETLRAEAVAALGRMGTLEAVQALLELSHRNLPETLAAQVEEEVGHPLRPLEARYQAGAYWPVINEAKRLLADPQILSYLEEKMQKPQLLNLLGKAECSLVASGENPEARDSCIEHLEEARATQGADAEALRLLANSYGADASVLLEAGKFDAARKALLAAIAQNPTDAYSFDLLRQSYVRQGSIEEGERMFVNLRDNYPASRELALILAFFYHEDLSRTDPRGGYEKALREIERLVKLDGRADPLLLTNLAEAQLTAQRYEATVQTANQISGDPKARHDLELNARFFRYAALLFLQEPDGAQEALQGLERSYRKLPEGFHNDWIFAGTLRFLGASALPPAQRKALIALGELIQAKQSGPRAVEVFAANRAALRGVTRGADENPRSAPRDP